MGKPGKDAASEVCSSAHERARTQHGAAQRASQLVLQAQRRQGRADVVVDVIGGAGSVEATQQAGALVVIDQRRGLLVVDLQTPADRLLLVVLALDQTRA